MRRNRFFSLPLIAVLLLASLGVATPVQVTLAAGEIYEVDTALNSTPVTTTTCDVNVPKDCSLREALILANTSVGSNTITFFIPDLSTDPDNGYDETIAGNPRWIIKPTATLPTLTDAGTTITGPLNPSANFTPQVVIDGSLLSSGYGLQIQSSDNIINQLVVTGFKSGGIRISDPIVGDATVVTNNQIKNNWIGVRPNDPAATGNTGSGIEIRSSNGNTIGGNQQTDRNIIAGNTGSGLLLDGANANTIIYNYIGFTLTGSFVARGNTGDGIKVFESSSNTIGGETASSPLARNFIGNNGGNGILITGTNSKNNTLAGNFIGVGVSGAGDAGNGGAGVRIEDGASNNTVKGVTTVRSVISGNTGAGVEIRDDTSSGNKVSGVFIGTSQNGNAAIPNDDGGIRLLDDTDNNIIGGIGQGNVIAGNTGYGVLLGQTQTGYTDIFSNTLIANTIGLRADGTSVMTNTLGGIFLGDGSTQNRIGGAATGEGNIIAGNNGAGITISGTAAVSNTVQGNIIGLSKAASGVNAGKYAVDAHNGSDGITISGAKGTTIGGDTAAAGNTIAANTGNGIRITSTGTTTTTLRFNTIGTTKIGNVYLAGLGNKANGILVESAAGPVQIRNSTIYSNTLDGVRIAAGVQRVAILDTSFTANGAKGIALGAGANHDIAPPYALRVNQNKQITGRVVANVTGQPPVASACITCTIQFFGANPATLDGEGRDQLAVTNYTITSNGYFTATLPVIPRQIAVTATDIGGNTSEFTTFTVTPSLKLTNYGLAAKSASPTDTISYTFRVTNTGTLDLTDLKVVAASDKRWTITPSVAAPGALSLAAGASAPLTLTLTLPVGTDARVIAGTIDTSYITVTSTLTPTATASAQARTTVLSSFVLDVTPKAISGEGVTLDPDQPDVREYVHTLTNTGNLTGTVSITATTDLFSTSSPEDWKTTVDVAAVTLSPGQSQSVTVRVQLPYGGAAGTVAKTTLAVTQTNPLPTKTLFFTDTTTIVASRRATITPSRVGDGAAAQVTTFEHTVTNFSNTATKFKITGVSNRGSAVSFRSKTPGVQLGADGSFTVGTSETNNTFTFYVDILVDPKALRGDTDVVTITLSDAADVVVGGVQDVINVTKSAVVPRLYLPLMFK